MKPELQRIAIAEACGWEWDANWLTIPRTPDLRIWVSPSGKLSPLLDYTNDLDAVHEAEKGLNFQQRSEYVSRLSSMVSHGFDFCHATATQRAEAFLRTLGLWIEEDTKP